MSVSPKCQFPRRVLTHHHYHPYAQLSPKVSFDEKKTYAYLVVPMRSLPFVTAVLVLTACSKATDSSPGAEPVVASVASSVTPPAPAESASASSAPQPSAAPGIAATLAQRLVNEAQSRPPIHPNADEVLVAFANAGGGVAAKKQGLAVTYKARFCEGGTTNDGAVTLSVCEYADDDSAKGGLAALQAIYPAKQSRHVLHKDTVLTTLRLLDRPAAQALESKLVAVYLAL